METHESAPMGRIGGWVRAAGAGWWGAVAAWAVGIYAICAFVLPGAVAPDLSFYLIQPLLWLSLAAPAWLGWRAGLSERPLLLKGLLSWAVLVGLLQVALSVLAGLVFGFFRSPYGHRLPVLLGNLLYAGTALLGMEMARAYLVAALGRRRPWLALGLVWLFFGLLSIPLGAYRGLQDPVGALPTNGTVVLPTLSQGLLATLLAFLGGPAASFAYRAMLQAFEWLSPLLPDLRWTLTALLGTLVPAFAFLAVYNRFATRPAGEVQAEPGEGQSTSTWLLVAATAVGLVGLNSGLFGLRSTLIASGSMAPRLQVGDVVITQEMPAERVRVNDIIRFREKGVYIIHRVMEVQKEGGQITFITRGDANNTDDPPVPGSALEGKAILTVPKIGWVSIGIRQLIDRIL